MGIPLKDMNQTVELKSKYDDEAKGPATIFKLRALSNSQMVELMEDMETKTISTSGSIRWLTDVFSFAIKDISGLDVQYTERELGEKKLKTIDKKWLDETISSLVVIDIASQAMKIYGLNTGNKKNSENITDAMIF